MRGLLVAGRASVPECVEGTRNLPPRLPFAQPPSGWRPAPLPWGHSPVADQASAARRRPPRSALLPKHPYNREKREKELKRQRKREEKEQRRLDRAAARAEGADAAEPAAPDDLAAE